jgi:hypothetical protein
MGVENEIRKAEEWKREIRGQTCCAGRAIFTLLVALFYGFFPVCNRNPHAAGVCTDKNLR